MNGTMTKMAAVVFAFTCAAGVRAQFSVTVYGLVDVGMDWSKAGSTHQVRMFSGGSLSSRLGFSGVEDLGGGLSAVLATTA
jgi:predicted porin